jgi:hypothetical protein
MCGVFEVLICVSFFPSQANSFEASLASYYAWILHASLQLTNTQTTAAKRCAMQQAGIDSRGTL